MLPDPGGPSLRIATYNIEWFDGLFDDDGHILNDGAWSARHDVTRADQLAAIRHVLLEMDPDILLVVEAPDVSRRRDGAAALEGFARDIGLRAHAVASGFFKDTQQELMVLYDPARIIARHRPRGPITGPAGRKDAPRFDGVFRIDLDIDATEDLVVFSKPPLELELDTPLGLVELIGVHVKSKAPHGARDAEDAMRISIANRRKQLAQCIWLRQRIDQHLDDGTPLIVLGDLNDGPGLDSYEALFGRSGVEIVMGTDAPAERRLFDPHARQALQSRVAAQPTTARFYLSDEKRYLSALLDYIMVSPDLRPRARDWRIWHPFDDPACWRDEALRTALLTASDHFPVTLELTVPRTE